MPASIQDGGGASDAAAHAAASAGPQEIVIRPEGLGRGVWEGPVWLFVVVAVVCVALAVGYGLRRAGFARLRALFGRRP